MNQDSFADSFWNDLVQQKPPGREGMVTVYDSVTHQYLGCMGIETWEWLLSHPEAVMLQSILRGILHDLDNGDTPGPGLLAMARERI